MASKKKPTTKKKPVAKKKAGKKTVKKTSKKVTKPVAKKSAKKKVVKKATKKAAPKKVATKAKKAAKKVATKKPAAKKSSAKKSGGMMSQAKASVSKVLKQAKKTVEETVEKVKQAIPSSTEDHSLIGSMAPKLKLQNQDGQEVDLADVIENNPKVVLYFYPKDDTPGCTTEACNFRDNMSRIQQSSAVVLGVSPDAPDSHRKFADKFNLKFDLLSDVNQELSQTFQVWKEKTFMGRNYMGIDRSTFLFHNGRVVKVWQPVKVEGHVDEVLKEIESLG